MRAHRFDKDATKRLLEQEGIDSSWNSKDTNFWGLRRVFRVRAHYSNKKNSCIKVDVYQVLVFSKHHRF